MGGLAQSKHGKAALPLDPKGSWRVAKVAAYSLSPTADPVDEKKHLGQVLTIDLTQTALLEDRGTLGTSKRWDTQSGQWLEEFRTNPKDLNLPRYVRTHDLGFGVIILRSHDRLLLDLGGTWYLAYRVHAPTR